MIRNEENQNPLPAETPPAVIDYDAIQNQVPIVLDRRNPTRNRVAPHRAGDSQPTPLRIRRNGRYVRRNQNNLNRNEQNNNDNLNQNNNANIIVNNMGNENINNIADANEEEDIEIENIVANENENEMPILINNDENDSSDVLNRRILNDALIQAANGINQLSACATKTLLKNMQKYSLIKYMLMN